MRKCWPRSASRWMTSREWAARRLRRKRTARTGSDGQEDCLDRPGQGRRSRHRSANRDAYPARVGAVHTNRGGRRQTPSGHRTAGVSLARGRLPHSLLRSRRYHRDSRRQAPLRGLPLKKVEFEPTTLRLTAEWLIAAERLFFSVSLVPPFSPLLLVVGPFWRVNLGEGAPIRLHPHGGSNAISWRGMRAACLQLGRRW